MGWYGNFIKKNMGRSDNKYEIEWINIEISSTWSNRSGCNDLNQHDMGRFQNNNGDVRGCSQPWRWENKVKSNGSKHGKINSETLAIYQVYSEPLKSTNLTELCQISLGHRWIRKSNKLTKSKVNPNGTSMYDKLCFGKFCCVKNKETPCGRNSQNIFKMVLNTTKNTHVILGRQWFTTCRLQVITRKAAFTCWIL